MSLLLALLLLAPQDDARALIEKLRTGTLEERDDATRRLMELGKAAAPELEKAAKDHDAEVAGRARHLLARLQLADTLSPALQKAFPGIADKLAFGGDAAWTHALIEAEKLSHPKSRIPVLKRADLEALGARAIRGADTVELKCEVAEAAVRRRLASAAPEILKFFDDGDEDLWELAVVAAQQHPTPDCVRRLRDLTRHESSDVRTSALQALENLKIREAAPDAARLLADPDAWVRAAAASALAAFRGKEAAADLDRLLKDREDHVRRAAVDGLLALYAKEEASKIAPLLKDNDRKVRESAATALGLLGHREAIPQLIAL
ncbi:MAG TPA: HEAT repeat domain-containing protein, partial [Planctomycetota bacterium]|nr:HEAT repeat domain-containing protein [Planctomycetota bacterium]